MILYRLFLWLYPVIAKLISPFNEKAKHWVKGQAAVWEEIEMQRAKINGSIIWVHCASYGEFEQGLPIIKSLKINYPLHQIWVSFFSPSGYLHRKQEAEVDFVTYLPLDGPKAAARWMELVQPKCIVFIKYEFWFYYLKNAAAKNIPTILASAIFRPDQVFFTFYGGFYRKMLQLFTTILVQDNASAALVRPLLTPTQLSISGDTRFDRVVEIVSAKETIDWMYRFADKEIIVAGSTWEKDHKLLGSIVTEWNALNWMIVPHHVDSASINECQKYFPDAVIFSEWINSSESKMEKPIVLIVDQIGLLRNLYQYAKIAYIGGGFTKDGIHNVLEAAAFGKPVIWGPNDAKFQEAIGLRRAGGGIKIEEQISLNKAIESLLTNSETYKNKSEAAKDYVQQNAGATQKTIEKIKQIYA
jgi:3-deoxy-D-manno-octulosonic-acid transferase